MRKVTIEPESEEDNNNVRKVSKSRSHSRSRSRSRSRDEDNRSNVVQVSGYHNILLQSRDKFVRRRTLCRTCDKETCSIRRMSPNEFTWVWCALTTLTSFCLAPFFIEKCNDRLYYCSECLEMKDEIKGTACGCLPCCKEE